MGSPVASMPYGTIANGVKRGGGAASHMTVQVWRDAARSA